MLYYLTHNYFNSATFGKINCVNHCVKKTTDEIPVITKQSPKTV